MEIFNINNLISGIFGLIVGLFAPWVKWLIERYKIRHNRRIEIIKEWRSIINTTDFDRDKFLNHTSYGPLRELLKEQIREELEQKAIVLVVDSHGGYDYYRDLLLKEIARIEKEWKLI